MVRFLQVVTTLALLAAGGSSGQDAAPLPSALPRPLTLNVAPTPAAAFPVPDLRVRVHGGALLGRALDGGIRVWQGVPYAAPPTGERRWQPPQPPAPWTGLRAATALGDVCPQPLSQMPGDGRSGVRGAEDCLFLNVYAPPLPTAGRATRTPVMVWLHGGSFRSGAGSDYAAEVLAREQGVTVVTLNYRLGALGFLAAPALADGTGGSGNYGLMDQQEALRWVRRNIAAFGGDPRNVTVFGESAGAMSICAQLASPLSRGLFDRAILQSGPCTPQGITTPLSSALTTGSAYARALGCAPQDAACLRAVPAARLLDVPVPGSRVPGAVELGIVSGDRALPRPPAEVFAAGAGLRVPVLLGTNRDEGTLFVAPVAGAGQDLPLWQFWAVVALLERWDAPRALASYPAAGGTVGNAAAALVTDSIFACPTSDLAADLARTGPVYTYEFRDPAPPLELSPTASVPRYGASHASELVSVFGTRLAGLADPAQFTAPQAELARTLRTYWANFARRGDPNGPGLAPWAPYDADTGRVMGLAPGATAEFTGFRQDHRCGLWDRLAVR
ncbi:carboxylesterase/lipase family protein [Deinococcus sp. Leaf326]|uniref:carboxylesterase/lipase family protein n=1 Tax=Deinococcus sp. Leaf326 TaxID=1736338 RepID=UPI0006F8E114|nr:carboxylesterase family protein [Deinococcus sp. Leaf326]KQQ97735.1 carboxylesterase [Deinococcus sp. Leaf326]